MPLFTIAELYYMQVKIYHPQPIFALCIAVTMPFWQLLSS